MELDGHGFDNSHWRLGWNNLSQLKIGIAKQGSIFGLSSFLAAGLDQHDDVHYLPRVRVVLLPSMPCSARKAIP